MTPNVKKRINAYLTHARMTPLPSLGPFCAFCGGKPGTDVALPVGVAYDVTYSPKFPEKILEKVETYDVESVSIKVDDVAYLNLKSVACSASTIFQPVRHNDVETAPQSIVVENLYALYTYGVFSPLIAEVGRVAPIDLDARGYVHMAKDYSKEEYLDVVKSRLIGKTAVFIFKHEGAYASVNDLALEVIQETRAVTLYSREINNRNSGRIDNPLTLRVCKFHD